MAGGRGCGSAEDFGRPSGRQVAARYAQTMHRPLTPYESPLTDADAAVVCLDARTGKCEGASV
eukprot:3288877-Prymnesium_polylepis.1